MTLLWCVCPTGPLPPSWGALTKLRKCYLFNNTLSGPLPSAWSGMAALEDLSLFTNALEGTVPHAWGDWGRVKIVELYANPQLKGCLPAAWRDKVNANQWVGGEGPYRGGNMLTAGTAITGYC
jgi:hypothetical protein